MINNHSSLITSQSIVFFGSGDYSIPVVEMLQDHGLVYVLTTEVHGPLIEFLENNNISYSSTHVTEEKNISKKELWDQIQKLNPTLGVLASFGAIIPQRIIDVFPHGIWNIHPSLLPKYKGPSPIQATLLSGDTKTGVTIITLDDQVDHGPILAQKEIPLTGTETLTGLKHSLFTKGAEIIEVLLTELEKEKDVIATPQDHSQESFTEKVNREDGFIDFQNPPSSEVLDRKIRAYYPWPGVWTRAPLFGKEKIIKLFPDEKIQVEGKKVMSYKEFVNGYQEKGEKVLLKLGLKA